MPNDLLPTDPPPPPVPLEPRPPERPSKITCQFCECVLVSANGDVLRMSEVAKAYRDQSDKIEQLGQQLTDTRDELAAARTRIGELEAANPPRPRSMFSK